MYKGILGLVLWLSMLSGVLPYKLGSCWLTILLVPYTFIVFSFTSLFITANHVLLFIYKYDKSQSSITMQIIQWCSNSLLILVNAIGIFTAVKRLRNMNRSLKQLKQMKEKLTHMSIPRDTRTQCLVLISILMTGATRGTDYFLFVFQHIKWFHNNSQLTVHQCWMILVQMQTVAFAARVLLYLRAINDTLYKLTIEENLQTKIIKEDRIVSNFAWEHSATYTDAGRLRNVLPRYKSIPINVANKVANITTSGLNQDESVEYTIRRISECYNIVLNIVRKTTEVDGKLIIVIIFCHMLYSELNLFRFIVWVTGEEKVTIVTMYVLVHSILHALALMVLVDPFHRTHAEMERTSLLVQSLKFRCKDHQPLYNELELFQRHLLLQKTTYSPLGMCTLDRSLVLNIFGTLISYLIIITTYGPPVDSPLLFMLSKEA